MNETNETITIPRAWFEILNAYYDEYERRPGKITLPSLLGYLSSVKTILKMNNNPQR